MTLAAMTSGEVSTLHMALFIATVWICPACASTG